MSGEQASAGLGRLGRHGMMYGLGVLLGRLVSFIMLPIYTRYLTPSDYGALQLITMVLEVISIVAGSRLSAGVFYLYHKAAGEQGRREIVSSAFAVVALSYTVVGSLTWLLADPLVRLAFGSAEYAGLLRLAAWALVFEGMILVPMAYFQVRERSGAYVATATVRLLLQLSFNIALVVGLGWAARGVLTSTLVTNILVGGTLAVLLVRSAGARVTREAAGELLRFGLPLVGTQVATFIATFGDRYFLNRAANTAAVGIYGLAYQFGFLYFSLAYTPFNNIWEPVRFEVAKRPDRDALFARAFVYFNVLLVCVAVAMVLFVGDFLTIVAAPEFRSAAVIVPVVVVAYLLQAWTGFHNVGVQAVERTDLIMWANWIGAGVAVAGYLLLIPRMFGMGAALATVASFAVREALIYAWSQRLWPIAYRWGPVLRLLALGAVVSVAGLNVRGVSLITSLALHAALGVLFLVGLWFAGVFSEADRRILRDSIRSPRGVLSRLLGAAS